MTFLEKCRKSLVGLIIAIFALTFLTAVVPDFTPDAEARSFVERQRDRLGSLFEARDQDGLTFTDFQGEFTQLDPDGFDSALVETDDIREFILRVVNFSLGFLGLLAVIVVIWGGVLYVSSAGGEERTAQGKKAIQYAVIGLLIVLFSFAFVNTVISSAIGGDDELGGSGQFAVGINTGVGGSFNAAAAEVRSFAEGTFNGFIFLAESTEEIRNVLNDSRKASLNYETSLVKRSDMLNFLFSVKERVLNMRSRVERFSTTYVRANDLIRQIDNRIDQINSLNRTILIDPREPIDGEGGINPLQIEAECVEGVLGVPVVDDIISGGRTLDIAQSDECKLLRRAIEYPDGLHELWQEIQEDDFSNNENNVLIAQLLKSISDEYLETVLLNIADMIEIKDSLRNVEAFTGEIEQIFDDMLDLYGFDPFLDIPNPFDPNRDYGSEGGFIIEIDNWRINRENDEFVDRIDTAGNLLFAALEKQLEFQDALANLQSVEARIRANVTTGNAPLTVTFDILGSQDPAGGSIIASNVEWFVDENITFDGQTVETGDAIACNEAINNNEELVGPTFFQCAFRYPGTYAATVRIRSNDPTRFVDGQSTIFIRVNPPSTQIDLNLTAGSHTETVLSYYENGIINIDKDVVPVTLDEAREGIQFDASSTPNVRNFKWDFGNGRDRIELDSVGRPDPVVYEAEGQYRVELEVQNDLGEVDRKLFTLDVRDTAARISITPDDNPFVGQSVNFDASASSSTSGSIRSHEWTMTQEGSEEPIELGQKSNQKNFNHVFDEPGNYTITLRVVSSIDNQPIDALPKTISVRSRNPVASFENNIPDRTQPSTVHFDATRSFDPDGDARNLIYEWSIEPDTENGENWILVNGQDALNTARPVVKFKEKGTYDVTLRAIDSRTQEPNLEFGEETRAIDIDNVLDIAWAADQEVTAILNDESEAEMAFEIISENAIAFEIEFGDGETASGEVFGNSAFVEHTYREAGQYNVKATVFDEEDDDNSIQRRVFIGGGDEPIAKIGLAVNGADITDLSDEIEVTTSDVLTFDAGESVNVDGTGRKLRYSWDFGDTTRSSNKKATHSYNELSPRDEEAFIVTLKVSDEDDPTLTAEDEIRINVINREPTFTSIQAVPDSGTDELITPINVNLTAFGANDPDGQITQFRWWYFDVDDPDDELGIQITTQPSAKMLLGTNGREGEEITYGFGLEITDQNNASVSSEDLFTDDQIPTITVINGPNELPTAKFNVSNTKVFTGDSITFTSASDDPDGNITTYVWDIEGDGFFNNLPTDEPVFEHTYTEQDLQGYDVRLKVIDDKGGEAVSDIIKIFVESLAEPPRAAFRSEGVEGETNTVQFSNNTIVDEDAGARIISYEWDFDTNSGLISSDSDGDGFTDNDIDSRGENPTHTYDQPGEYFVKLTVTDNQGNKDEVVNIVQVGVPQGPIRRGGGLDQGITPNPDNGSQFALVPILDTTPATSPDGKIHLTGDSSNIIIDFSKSTGDISAYIVDKNILFDTNGNGITDDDEDFRTTIPGRWTTNFERAWGQIILRLTVLDSIGNSQSITREVVFD